MAETCKFCKKDLNSGIWLSPQFTDEKVLLFCSGKCKEEYLKKKLERIKVDYPNYYEKIKEAAENESSLCNKEIYAPFIEAIKYEANEKTKLWRRVKKSLGLLPLRIGRSNISRYIDKVREANNKLIGQKEPQFQSIYKIEDEDVEIIASFLKSKIKMVYTSDRAFHETCKILGLNSKLITMNDYREMKRRIG